MPSVNLSVTTLFHLILRGQRSSPYLIPGLLIFGLMYPSLVLAVGLMGLLYIMTSTKPIKIPAPRKKAIPKPIKDKVWNTWIGVTVGQTKCPLCSDSLISQSNFHCGHVIAESRGGSNTCDNLRPICATCNLSMTNNNLFEYAKRCFPHAPILKFK